MLGSGQGRVLSVPFVGRNDEQFLQGTQVHRLDEVVLEPRLLGSAAG
jgi:hypothetical protein